MKFIARKFFKQIPPQVHLTFKMGIIPSFAIACNKRGAPVNDCNPAPIVDMKAPTNTTHLLGQAIIETMSSFPRLSPNLEKFEKH